MNKHSRTDRVGAACGAAFVLLTVIGNQLDTGGDQAAHPTGAADLHDFAVDPTVAQAIGFRMELLGVVALIGFVAWLDHALRARAVARRWLAGVCTISGTMLLAIKLGSGAPILAGQLDHGQIDATMARVLTDMNSGAFVISFLPAAVFVLAGAIGGRDAGLVGRFGAWAGVAIGTLGVLVPLATGLDPIGTNPMPFLAGLLWILCVSARLAWRGPHVATTVAETPVAVAA